MEKPCYKCGQTVEEGIPFCPHCAAPQIRVLIAEPAPQPLARGAATEAQESVALPASQTVPVLALPMQWSDSLKASALASLVGSLLMYLRLHPFAAMGCTGFLAVVFYRQRSPGIAIRPGAGARLGALSGLLSFAMSSGLAALLVIFLHKGPELRDAVTAQIQALSSQTSDPQLLALFARVKTPGGFEFWILLSLIAGFFASVVLGGLGGALGGAIFGRRNRT